MLNPIPDAAAQQPAHNECAIFFRGLHAASIGGGEEGGVFSNLNHR